ncbi:MAG: hypothetical protein M3R08_05160 [Bacteroidota bacterium]|nr:hypothetical protein [Bacteroidota bacterium]
MSKTNNPKTMATEKAYIGNGRQKQGSEYITISLDVDQLLALMNSRTTVAPNGKYHLNAVIAKRRSPDQFGRTHTIYLPEVHDHSETENNRLVDHQEMEHHRM